MSAPGLPQLLRNVDESQPAAAAAQLKDIILGNHPNDVESVKVKESAISKLTDLLVKQGDAAALAGLLTELRPLFNVIPKAKTAKIVRTVIDSIARVPNSTQLQVGRRAGGQGGGSGCCGAAGERAGGRQGTVQLAGIALAAVGGLGRAAAPMQRLRQPALPLPSLHSAQQHGSELQHTTHIPLPALAAGGVQGAGGVGDDREAHLPEAEDRDQVWGRAGAGAGRKGLYCSSGSHRTALNCTVPPSGRAPLEPRQAVY